MTTPPTGSAVLLILAGRGTSALRRTLDAVTMRPEDVWCAVPSETEADAAVGQARTIILDPWPGQRSALATLVSAADVGNNDVVQTLVAGSIPDHDALRRSMRRGPRAPLVFPATNRWRTPRGIGVRGFRRATLRPGAGMTVRGSAVRELDGAGWFDGTAMTVSDVQRCVGRIRLARPRTSGGVETAPPGPVAETTPLSVTVVIPAHNEQSCIGDTLRSVFAQTRFPDDILVIDDGSSDETGTVAAHVGARVLQLVGTGSKGAAINGALASVDSDVMILVDADTRLHPEAIHYLMQDMEAGADATHGAVLPSIERGLWARGRLIEYANAMRLYKRVQRSLGQIMVLSGCLLAVRTDTLRATGGFQPRTMVEDLDLTWTLHQRGLRVEYSARAVAYPIEPVTWGLYKAQMRRWSRGLFQCVAVHARMLHRTPSIALIVVTALWDAITGPLALVGLLGLAAAGLVSGSVVGWVLIWQVVWTLIAIVIATTAIGLRRAVRAAPAYTLMCTLVSYFYFEAFVTEWLLRRRLQTWTKGH